ncbi:MAG: YjbQ family protein [Ignavibacteriae bacterium]|nr:YjbQ family protein [Ignavibacteriota bacterium]
MYIQTEINLKPKNRGFHIITREIENAIPEMKNIKIGIANIFIKHTSASLTINENVSPDVRRDMEKYFNNIVSEKISYFEHTYEGADDMPAHIKSSLLGPSLTIPITDGKLNLGTWQGIYLCEHRDYGGSRKIVITLMGE